MSRNAWLAVVGLAVVLVLGAAFYANWPKRYIATVALVSPTPLTSVTHVDDNTPPMWEAKITGGDVRAVMAASEKFQSDVLGKVGGRLDDFCVQVYKYRHQYLIAFSPTANLRHYTAIGIPPYADVSFAVSRSDYTVTGDVLLEPAVHPPTGKPSPCVATAVSPSTRQKLIRGN